MAYVEWHDTVRNHPKMDALMLALKIRRREAVGIIGCLASWAIQFRPGGRLEAKHVGVAVEWEGLNSELVATLVDIGWLDPIDDDWVAIHDWKDVTRGYIKARKDAARKKREYRKTLRGDSSERRLHSTEKRRVAPRPDQTGPELNRGGTHPPSSLTAPATIEKGKRGRRSTSERNPQHRDEVSERREADRHLPVSAPTNLAQPIQTDERQDSELQGTLAALEPFGMPGRTGKTKWVLDLLRQGVSHERIQAAARANPKADLLMVYKMLTNGTRAKEPAPPPLVRKPGPKCAQCSGTGQDEVDDLIPGEDKRRWGPCPRCKQSGLEPITPV
jgi:hypothetical protein